MFHKPKVPSINLIKYLKSKQPIIYIYIYIERERERERGGGGGELEGFEPQIGDTIKNVARLLLEPPKINLRDWM